MCKFAQHFVDQLVMTDTPIEYLKKKVPVHIPTVYVSIIEQQQPNSFHHHHLLLLQPVHILTDSIFCFVISPRKEMKLKNRICVIIWESLESKTKNPCNRFSCSRVVRRVELSWHPLQCNYHTSSFSVFCDVSILFLYYFIDKYNGEETLTFLKLICVGLTDEPTNHLDIQSVDALAKALQEFKGAVILISHDQRLITTVCNELWVVGNQKVTIYNGTFDDYRQELINQMPDDLFEDEDTTIDNTGKQHQKK
jgi:hypothetical protein